MTLTTKSTYFVHDLTGITNQEVEILFRTHNKNSNYIIHKVHTTQIKQFHQGTHSTKTKSEVQGGGRKPWRQKGTGRARAGSNRSPLWRGGGVIFGPKNQQCQKKINRKEKALALQTCLKNRSSNIIITENFAKDFSRPNTKLILQILNKWGINNKDKILIITKTKDTNLYLSIRNIPNINLISVKHLNISSLLLAKTIVISKDSLPIITKAY